MFMNVIRRTLTRDIQSLKQMRLYEGMGSLQILNEILCNKLVTYKSFVAFSNQLFGPRLLNVILKPTILRTFACVDDAYVLNQEMSNLNKNNIGVILDYCSEAESEQDPAHLLDRNLLEAVKSINLAKNNIGSGIAGIKISALMNIKMLRKLSKLNQRLRAVPSQKPESAKILVQRLLAGRTCEQEQISGFCKQILGLDSAQQQISKYHWLAKIKPYYFNDKNKNNNSLLQTTLAWSKDQLTQLEAFRKRYESLLKEIQDEKCKVLIDAQQTYINDGISVVTSELQEALNTRQPIIFTTIQNYLVQAPNLIEEQIQIKKLLGLKLAVKIVKGAYIYKQIDLAKAQNRPSPICPTFQATSLNYNNSLKKLIGIPDSFILVATHNFQSVELALQLIRQRATPSQNVIIAQLKGIADTLTYQLSKNNQIRVFKYLPYAEPQKMQAYLVRRSQQVGSAKYPTHQKIVLLKDQLKKRMYLS